MLHESRSHGYLACGCEEEARAGKVTGESAVVVLCGRVETET